MNCVKFRIKRISSGWFVSEFMRDEQATEVWASDAWGHDAPKHFLDLLLKLALNKGSSGYVVFDDEPGTYIICIQNTEKAGIDVLYSNLDHDEWRNLDFQGKLTRKEIEREIEVESLVFSVSDIDLNALTLNVIQEFERYVPKRERDQYKGNWMDFPIMELQALKKALRP